MTSDLGHPRRWAILGVLVLSVLLLVTSITSVTVALPTIATELGASDTELQWIIDAYSIVFGGLLLLGGAISDRFGRRNMLLLGLLVFIGSSAMASTSSTTEMLIAARAVGGIGGALMMPSTLATLTEVFPAREQPRAIAIWSGVAGGGAALGPLAGGWLVHSFWWGSVFLLNVVIGSVAVVGVVSLVPRSRAANSRPLDIPGAVSSTATMAALLFTVIEGPAQGWSSPLVLASAATGVASLAFFGWWERRTPHPMVDITLLSNRRLRVGALVLPLSAIGFVGVVFTTSQLLQFSWHETALVTGALLAPMGIIELAVAPTSTNLGARFGVERVIPAGLLLMATGYLALAIAPTGARAPLVLATLVAGVGNALVIPSAVNLNLRSAPPAKAGVVAGINESSLEIGAAAGIAVLGSIMSGRFRSLMPDFVSESGRRSIVDATSEVVERLGEEGTALIDAAVVSGYRWSMVATAALMALTAAGARHLLVALPD